MRLALLSLAFLAGCQDYLFAPVCPQTIEESRITAAAADPTPADILFVVDNSGSMADDQRRIADSFDAFINQLSAVQNASYRIAIVTTDLTSDLGERSGEVVPAWDMTEPYELDLMRYDNSACRNTGIMHGCFRGPDETARIISSSLTAAEQDRLFTDNVTVGSSGAGTEQGLAAAIRALENTGDTECNRDFLRDGANLVIIFVTDEQDASPDDVADYVNQLALHKGWSAIRAAGIFGSVDGIASSCAAVGGLPSNSCGSQCDACPAASWCSTVDRALYDSDGGQGCGFCSYFNAPDCCSAISGSRYQDFLEEVDARVKAADPAIDTATLVDSICQDDFSATLRRIASEIVFDPCFTLTETPVNPDGIAAQVAGGRTLEKGVDFDVVVSPDEPVKVCLTSPNVLGPGEQLEISFVTKLESRPSVHPACN